MSTTLKLKSKRPDPAGDKPASPRAPVRGPTAGVKKRPTLAEAQAYRAERAARQERAEQAERSRSSEGTRRAEAPRPDKRARPSGPARPGEATRPTDHPRSYERTGPTGRTEAARPAPTTQRVDRSDRSRPDERDGRTEPARPIRRNDRSDPARAPQRGYRDEAPRGGERMQRSDQNDRGRQDNRSERTERSRPSSGPADPRFPREAARREAPPYAPRPSERNTPRPEGRPPAAALQPRGARREPPATSRGDRPVRPDRPHQPNTAFGPRAGTRREPTATGYAPSATRREPPATRYEPARRDSSAGRSERPDSRRDPATPRDESPADAYVPVPHAPGTLRLSKRMSELGLASRREADEWIAKGWVRVDDQVVSELGSRVLPEQRITVDAKARHQQAQRVTVLINKPVGYVSGQAEDGYEPAFVLVTPDTLWAEDHSGTRFMREHLKSLVPAGRLDIDSVGLLVLTQDGRVAKQLIGEDSEVDKEYLVRVAMAEGATLPESALALLRHGLELDGEALREAQVEWVNADQLRFVLHQGKKRQIRRMCEAVGLQVLGLKRVRIGKVMLGDLPTGQWRYLRADESFV